MKRRDRIYKKYVKAKNIHTKNEFEKQYKTLKNQIVNICRESEKLHFQNFFLINANNIRNTWIGVNKIININNKSNNAPFSLIVNNKWSTDPLHIPNEFNEYFSTVADYIQAKFYHTGSDYSQYLTNMNNFSFFIKPNDELEIIDTINNLKSNKASRLYSIQHKILHLIKLNIADPLTKLINFSLKTALYFDQLKVSKDVSVYKNGDILDSSNCRPISLLSNINKVDEKLMYERLYSFLSIHNCVYFNLLGFTKNHSTIHALIGHSEHIHDALDKNNTACGIFIDLQKAFDTVQHEILINKLAHYGISGLANGWFKSYLTNRQQFLSITYLRFWIPLRYKFWLESKI